MVLDSSSTVVEVETEVKGSGDDAQTVVDEDLERLSVLETVDVKVMDVLVPGRQTPASTP